MKRAWFVLVAVSLTGCYAYAPVEEVAPTPGTEVRAYLTPEGAEQLITRFGPGVQSLDGRFLRSGPEADSLIIAVDWVNANSNVFRAGGNTGMALHRQEIARLDAKQFDAKRSLLLAVAVAGGFYLLDWGVGSGGTGDSGEEPGPTPVDFLGLRVPIRLP